MTKLTEENGRKVVVKRIKTAIESVLELTSAGFGKDDDFKITRQSIINIGDDIMKNANSTILWVHFKQAVDEVCKEFDIQ